MLQAMIKIDEAREISSYTEQFQVIQKQGKHARDKKSKGGNRQRMRKVGSDGTEKIKMTLRRGGA